MRVEWFGQSAFHLDGEQGSVAIDPFGDMSALTSGRGIQWDYPAIAGLEPDLLLVTHEHRDHNAVEAIGGQSGLREEQAAALEGVDLLFVPVGGGFTIGAEQAALVVERLKPRWVVPMHYRTPRIGFLETAEEFLSRAPAVQRLEQSAFETGELAAADGPLVVVPVAP